MTSPGSENEPVPPVPNETAIFATEVDYQRLCDRCRSLDFDQLSREYNYPNIAIHVPISSLETSCYYCDSFRMLVSEHSRRNSMCTVEDISIRVVDLHSDTRRIDLDCGLKVGGNTTVDDWGSYYLLPVEKQRKKFRQTAGKYLDDEPAGFSMI